MSAFRTRHVILTASWVRGLLEWGIGFLLSGLEAYYMYYDLLPAGLYVLTVSFCIIRERGLL